MSNCITRLRIVVCDSTKVDHQALKSIPGVKGVIGKDKDVQVVIGLQAEHVANGKLKDEQKPPPQGEGSLAINYKFMKRP